MTLKLCMVGPLPLPAGGMANQTRDLVGALRGEGLDVTVVRTNRPVVPRFAARIPVIRAVLRFMPFLVGLWRGMSRADVAHVMANSGLSWYLFAVPPIWLARLHRVPVILNYRGGNARSFFERDWKRVSRAFGHCRAIVVPSPFLQEVFRDFGVAARVVPNFVTIEPRHTCYVDLPATPRLVVTRHLESIYDVATSIRAFERIKRRFPSASLTIAGDGPERGMLETLCHGLGIESSVHFAGNVQNDALVDLLDGAHVLLNSSRVDNTPISLIEALARGVPIVSTAAGGIPVLVQDGHTALLVPPGDHAALADAAVRVLDDPAFATTLIENGLRRASQFKWGAVRDAWLALYGEGAGARVAPGCEGRSS